MVVVRIFCMVLLYGIIYYAICIYDWGGSAGKGKGGKKAIVTGLDWTIMDWRRRRRSSCTS